MKVETLNESLMKTKSPQEWLIQGLKIDLGEIAGKNPSERLVWPTYKFAKSVTETNSKVNSLRPTMRPSTNMFTRISGKKS